MTAKSDDLIKQAGELLRKAQDGSFPNVITSAREFAWTAPELLIALCEHVENLEGLHRWRPIETAPTNQSVLVFIPNAEHYGPGIYRAILKETIFTQRRTWMTTGLHHGSDCGRADYQPTHWMPLPDPPERS